MSNLTGRQIFKNILFLYAILICSVVTIIFAILALVAGEYTLSLTDAAILTIDTSGVAPAVQSYLHSDVLIATIPDWYEVHFLSVCQGFWNTDVGTICTRRSVGYRFSLANELTSITPAAAAPLFAWPATWTLPTAPSVGLLVTALTLSFISILCYVYGLARTPTVVTGLKLNVLRVAFFAGIVSAILLTNSAAQITGITSKLTGSTQPDFIKVPLNIWTDKNFYVFIWVGVGMAWMGVIVSAVLSFIIGGILAKTKEKRLSTDRTMEMSEQE